MTSRILRLMLVFALFANQAAICGAHSHHDSEPSDHSARSHAHMSGHSHDGDHHDSSEHQHSDDLQPSDDSESGLDSSLPGDHDSDALFFGEQDYFQTQSNRLIAKDLSFVAILFVAQQPLVSKPACQSQRTRAGPFSTYRCAVYLQTSRLRI
jgi:hypothetical protein